MNTMALLPVTWLVKQWVIDENFERFLGGLEVLVQVKLLELSIATGVLLFLGLGFGFLLLDLFLFQGFCVMPDASRMACQLSRTDLDL